MSDEKPVTKKDVDQAFDELDKQAAKVIAAADVMRALIEDMRLQRKLDRASNHSANTNNT